MKGTSRVLILLLVLGALACAALAAFLKSEIAAVIAALCATVALSIAFSAEPEPAAQEPSAVQIGFDATTSATVDILDPPRPVVFESSDLGVEQAPTVPGSAASLYRPVLDPVLAAAAREARAAFVPRMPAGSEPRDVITALLLAARSAGPAVAAHLWLEDPATDTLRLVEAQGSVKPASVPVSISSGLLGVSLIEGTAHLGVLEPQTSDVSHRVRWRYALPLGGSDVRGVAGIDFGGESEPDRAMLTSVSAALRASLSGALALHVARTEAETARVLVETCGRLCHLLDPHDVLRTALDQAMQLAEAQTGSIMLIDPQTKRMRIAVSHGLPEDIVASTDISEGDGIAGWVLASRQPLVIEDLKDAGIRSRRHGIRSAVCVPLADDEGMIGVLNVGCTAFHARISRTHLHTLEALGRTVVMALRTAWATEGSQDLYFDTLKALALALETRDPYARGGTARVVELVEAIGVYLGVPESDTKALRVAAMLHDVGMSAAGTVVPVTDGPLSTVEWGMLKMHPVIAAEILSEAPTLANVIPLVYHHHEHFDGSGYVDGLSGADIPLGARILAVADAYVAMTSTRPYRQTLTQAQALGELQRLAGSQFDPSVVRALVEIVGEPGREGLLGN